MAIRRSYLIRIREVQQFALRYYEKGRHDKCFKQVWKKYVFPRFGINYNTFLRYMKTDVDKRSAKRKNRKKKHVLAYTNRPICKRNRRSSSVISHSGQLIPDESQHESFERFRGWMSDWRPPADGMLPAEKDRQPDATKNAFRAGVVTAHEFPATRGTDATTSLHRTLIPAGNATGCRTFPSAWRCIPGSDRKRTCPSRHRPRNCTRSCGRARSSISATTGRRRREKRRNRSDRPA